MDIQTALCRYTKELSKYSATPDLDTRVILEFVLKHDIAYVLSHPKMPLTNYQYSKVRNLINRRKKYEPIAYLTGHKEFYGNDFFVNKNVLIPRPESEWLVEQALNRIKNYAVRGSRRELRIKNTVKILDVGTGSGCIIISLILELYKLYELSTFNFVASDISPKTLNIARKNAKILLDNSAIQQSNNLTFCQSDLFSNKKLHTKYDIIIANLPYVPVSSRESVFDSEGGAGSKMNKMSIDFEPENAIFAEDNGTAIINNFLDQAQNYLNKDGLILIELDPRNAAEIEEYAQKVFREKNIELFKDLANFDRYLSIT